MKRRAQIETIVLLIAILTGVLILEIILILSTTQLKIAFHNEEVYAAEDQLPTLQAMSYSTAGTLIRKPITFYELAGASAASGATAFTFDRGESFSYSGFFDTALRTFSETQLSSFYPDCFEYAITGTEGGEVFTKALQAGSAEDCAGYVSDAERTEGLVQTGTRGFLYYLPLPPGGSGEARIASQFIRIFELEEGERSATSGKACLSAGAIVRDDIPCCGSEENGKCI